MATMYLFYKSSDSIQSLRMMRAGVTPVLLESQESFDLLCSINQGYPQTPFLAIQNVDSWEIHNFNEAFTGPTDLSNNVV